VDITLKCKVAWFSTNTRYCKLCSNVKRINMVDVSWSTSISLLLQRQPMTCSQHSMTMVALRSFWRTDRIQGLIRFFVSTLVGEFQRREIPLLSDPKVRTEISKTATHLRKIPCGSKVQRSFSKVVLGVHISLLKKAVDNREHMFRFTNPV